MTPEEERRVNELEAKMKLAHKGTRRISAFESIMAAMYGDGPLPVGLEKEKVRIKKFIRKSKGE